MDNELREAINREVEVCVVDGVAGKCLSINNIRVAGPKPWGGGNILTKWNITVRDIIEVFPEILSLAERYLQASEGRGHCEQEKAS